MTSRVRLLATIIAPYVIACLLVAFCLERVTAQGIAQTSFITLIGLLMMVCTGSMALMLSQTRRIAADEASDQMRGLANAAVEGLAVCDGDTIVIANSSFADLVGLAPSQSIGRRMAEFLVEGAAGGQSEAFSNLPIEVMLRAAEGGVIPVEVTRRPIGFRGRPHVAVAIYDLRRRKQAEVELREARAFLDTVIENVPAIILVKDAREFRYEYMNRAAETFFGVSRQQFIGRTTYEIYPKEMADVVVATHRRSLESGELHTHMEHELATPGNGTRRIIAKTLPIGHERGQPRHVVTFMEDVTERRAIEARIAHLAYHDALTDLNNRAAFSQHLALTLERASKSGEAFAAFCIDLDYFKQVNDACGHAVGDALLCEVADRLRAASGDSFIARLGGDEFAIVNVESPQPAAAALTERLAAVFARDVEIGSHRLRIGLSIGVAIYPADGTDATTLVGNGDAALYRAKAEGRGVTRFFEQSMDTRLRQQRALLSVCPRTN